MTEEQDELTLALATAILREIELFAIANGKTEPTLNMILRALVAVIANLP